MTESEGGGAVDPATARVLRAARLSVTAPRCVVYRALVAEERPQTAAQLYDALRGHPRRLGLTSIYRVLHSFAAAGLVHTFPGPEQSFRLCAPQPHAHLICEQCGTVVERPLATVRAWLAAAQIDADFVVTHNDLYGLCGPCRRRNAAALNGQAAS
jgi:Fur family ferric uptake transcriptional regulator